MSRVSGMSGLNHYLLLRINKMNYKQFQKLKSLRPIARSEIVLDCDTRPDGDLGIRRLALLFSHAGYRIEVYRAKGQKSYHTHIKDIPHIAELPKEQNKIYKELLIKKYISKVRDFIPALELDCIDFSLCVPDHLVAEENKPHFKYNKIKALIDVVNPKNKNFCEVELLNQAKSSQKRYKPQTEHVGITAQIIKRISIVNLARELGLEINSKGFALCPFHEDNNPSLKFYENQGRFCCFGCGTKGNIIYFYALMKKLNIQNEN